jgi:solute carrier family 25 S-adenosylmethionine transporter 26
VGRDTWTRRHPPTRSLAVRGTVPRLVCDTLPAAPQVGQYSNFLEAVRGIAAQPGGLSTFYLGFWTTVAREIPFSFIQFPMYEGLKKAWARRQGAETTPMQGAAEI